MADKYTVFKAADWDYIWEGFGPGADARLQERGPVPDAVVIRRQDIFAAPALDAYANAILIAAQFIPRDNPAHHSLHELANFFHLQASQSWQTPNRKIPD